MSDGKIDLKSYLTILLLLDAGILLPVTIASSGTVFDVISRLDNIAWRLP